MTDQELAIIVRLCNRKTLMEMFPGIPESDSKNWCQIKPPADTRSIYQWCTRAIGHTGPHVDFYLSDKTLIWNEGKVFQIDEGDE